MTANNIYHEIVREFLSGADPKPKLFNKVKVHGGGYNGFTRNGTLRMSYGTHSLYSYEHFTMATRLHDGTLFINNCRGEMPSKMTSLQYNILGVELRRSGLPYVHLSLDTFRRAGIALTTGLSILGVQYADVIIPATLWCGAQRDPGQGCLYLKDRQERHFVARHDRETCIYQLPVRKKYPRSLFLAYASLRPRWVETSTPERGGRYFVPAVGYRRKSGVEVQRWALIDGTRFKASSLLRDGDAIFVKGVVVHDKYPRLYLEKGWHRVVKNNAVASW